MGVAPSGNNDDVINSEAPATPVILRRAGNVVLQKEMLLSERNESQRILFTTKRKTRL